MRVEKTQAYGNLTFKLCQRFVKATLNVFHVLRAACLPKDIVLNDCAVPSLVIQRTSFGGLRFPDRVCGVVL